MYEYITTLICILIGTFIIEKKYHIHLYKNRKERFEIIGLFFAIGIIWNTFAALRGYMYFIPGNNIGFNIGILPIEEYLFWLIVPYFLLTIYKIVDMDYRKRKKIN